MDYAEVEVITSDTASQGTIENSESGYGSIKQEQNFPELDLDCERYEYTRTPGTLRHKATQFTNQLARLTEVNTELVMAREVEMSSIEKLMELMLMMRMEDEKRYERREEKTELEKLQREERRERESREQAERELRREEQRIERELKREEE